jgi:glycine betaine/proline transport system ATP-binding protein
MGLSGSGKSTLIRHINRLLEPSAGVIRINGDDVMAMSSSQLRNLRNSRVAMVFQSFGLMPHRSVRDNVALPLEIRNVGKSARWDAAEQALKLVELDGWEDRYPHELSGGMQQRVGLARALVADPDILLMDEPFSALDPLIRRQLQGKFLELSKAMRKTTIFITHDLDEAIRIGDRIAIMKDGRIVQVGTPEEIITEPADSYVADFVAGISKLTLVSAHAVMQPIEAYEQANGPVTQDFARAPETSTLDQLIDFAVSTNKPIVIISENRKELGVVTQIDLLKGLQGSDHE